MCFISSPAAMSKIGSVYRLRLRGRGWYTTKRTLDKRRTTVRRVAAKTDWFSNNMPLSSLRWEEDVAKLCCFSILNGNGLSQQGF
jgi:hypothetical protein